MQGVIQQAGLYNKVRIERVHSPQSRDKRHKVKRFSFTRQQFVELVIKAAEHSVNEDYAPFQPNKDSTDSVTIQEINYLKAKALHRREMAIAALPEYVKGLDPALAAIVTYYMDRSINPAKGEKTKS